MISVRFFFIFMWYSEESLVSSVWVSRVLFVEVELVVFMVRVMFILEVVIKLIEMLWCVRILNILVRKLWECSIFRLCSVSSVCW